MIQNRMITSREAWILTGVAVAALLGAGTVIWFNTAGTALPEDTFPTAAQAMPAPTGRTTPAPEQAPAASPRAPEPEIGVGVIGAVRSPGLYYFNDGMRVQDALDAAGGTLSDGDLSDINRTAMLIDETTLLVPRLVSRGGVTYREPAETYNPTPYTRSAWYQFDPDPPEPAASPSTERSTRQSAAGTAGGRININTASQQALESLPGIGPVTARKIMNYRNEQPFNRPEDLEKVSGIGPAKMAAVRELITVD